jgi:Homing endonuclease associated repeat
MQGKKILITKEQILSAIQTVAKDLGRAPTWEEMEEQNL